LSDAVSGKNPRDFQQFCREWGFVEPQVREGENKGKPTIMFCWLSDLGSIPLPKFWSGFYQPTSLNRILGHGNSPELVVPQVGGGRPAAVLHGSWKISSIFGREAPRRRPAGPQSASVQDWSGRPELPSQSFPRGGGLGFPSVTRHAEMNLTCCDPASEIKRGCCADQSETLSSY